jgi:cytochrome bd ubiquinol oxidase subunit I
LRAAVVCRSILLARIQFAFTVSFHFIFPAFSIGLASYLAVLEGLWLKTGKRSISTCSLLAEDLRDHLRDGRRLGHRHVLPVRHQLVGFLRPGRPGDRAADGLRGADRLLPRGRLPRRHAVRDEQGRQEAALRRHAAWWPLGTFVSAFWILSVNSWMHTPTGYEMGANGQFLPGDSWWDIVFNPSFPYRSSTP